ncbi:MAG: class I SAM-dependent methyltransferase [Alphaproteobacteria bacterium]|jgi:ubiquinone/menaquinone biosynthesis C-methylase UbiE|tara:strand:- start:353 stop:1135 length:783 start_codon:yes stop_codon:yes gene_type:complete
MSDNDTYTQYDDFMGRWSRQVATQFLDWIEVERGLRWLDVGCGAGMLAQTVIKNCAPSSVTGADPLEKSIVAAKQHPDNKNIQLEIGDAQDLPFEDSKFDAVISGLMIKFVPDKVKAICEMKRVVRPGSVIALYDWDMDSNMNTTRHFWEAVADIIPEREEDRTTDRTPMTEIDSIAKTFEAAGVKAVQQSTISFTTRFRNLDDYWNPITRNSQNVGRFYQTMTEEQQGAIHEQLKQSLPFADDGSISFESRAVAVKGIA